MILEKLMEKKDLDAYINLRIEYLKSIERGVLEKLPEKERGFIQERFVGRINELEKLLLILRENKIKDMSKQYFREINPNLDDGKEPKVVEHWNGIEMEKIKKEGYGKIIEYWQKGRISFSLNWHRNSIVHYVLIS